MRHSDFDKAMVDVDRAHQQFGRKSLEWAWRFRVLKAQIFVLRREYKNALVLLDEDLPSSLTSSEVAVRKNMVEGIAYRSAQRFDKAERKLADAEHLATSYQPKLLSEVLNNQGALKVEEKEYSSAEEVFRRALLLARQQNQRAQEASALTNLGYNATKQERFDEAIDWNQSALELSRLLKMRETAAVILGNMGWNYFDLGDFENALPLYTQAAEDSERRKLTASQAYWLTGVANSYYALHDYRSAQTILEQALKLARGLDEKSPLTECLNDLSAVALQTERVDLAEQYNKEALDIERAGLDQSGILYSQLDSARIESSKRHFSEAERLFRELIRDPKADTPLKWEAEARLAKVYDDEGKLAQAEKEYQKAIGTIEAARKSLKQDEFRLTFLSSGIEFYDDYIDFLIAHGRADDALNVAELSRARTLAEGLASTTEAASDSPRGIHPQQIARKLNVSLFFYWVGHDQSYLWVIVPGKTAYFKLPKAGEIEPLVKSYRKAILGIRDAQDAGSSDGKKLYAMLIEPAIKLIPKGSRVIVLPAESLYGLNFETLVVPEPQPHFWIEDVTLTTASSLTLLDSSLHRPLITGKNLLLVGNAVPTPAFPALAQAPAEMKNVGQHFTEQNRKILESSQATASGYLSSNPERFAYLHFVTHGTASRTRPLESAVILSPEGDSYKLYARDVVTHHLNAQLVTISACNTSGNRTISGEGLVGLSWAFLRAGAHNVIGALWEVSDASTPQLMDSLYNGLSRGKDPATALRDAKLSLLHSSDSDSVFRKPFYWAPFQLYAGS